jgi:hypothetical protein
MSMSTQLRPFLRVALTLAVLVLAGPAGAKPPAVPDYEVKFMLIPAKVLDPVNEPDRSASQLLHLEDSVTKLRMLFLDGDGRELNAAGWNVRLRTIEDKEGVEFTYKKRFPVEKGKLDIVLNQVASEGFDRDENDYEPQVEWGLARQTLSFTRKKFVDLPGLRKMELPEAADARRVSIAKIAGKLDRVNHEGWARDILARAHLYGPVKGRRWSGRFNGIELDFEVWEVRTKDGRGVEPIVELSFKEDDRTKAESRRSKLKDFLQGKGWLLEQEILKTQLILDRYARTPAPDRTQGSR